MEFPIIKTENLVLRNIEKSDVSDYYKYVSDPDIKFKFRFNHSYDSAKKRIYSLARRYSKERPPFVWAITENVDVSRLIGILSIDSYSAVNRNASLACGLIREYRNMGYGTEATIGLINYLFKVMKLHRLELCCTKDYEVSKRCFEKMGAVYEGIARGVKLEGGEFVDSEVYSILRDEWMYEDMECDYEVFKPKRFIIK